MTLTFDQAIAATRAQPRTARSAPAEIRVVTDTRALAAGDTFLALRGEHYDGHAFVAEAVSKGASALILESPAAAADGLPVLIVADTRKAYMQLAGAARAQFTGRVVGITGSNGKTTTKHLLAQLLARRYGAAHVLASPANENNEIGVSKLMFAASPQHKVLVVEMGARHAGEIADLTRIAVPDIGVLTNIGEAHLEIFGSREELAATKWGLFSQGAQAVLNAQDEISRARAPQLAAPPLWFGEGQPGMPGVWVRDDRALVLTHSEPRQTFNIHVPFRGAHNRANLAAAIAAALMLGLPPDAAAAAVGDLALPPGRYERIELRGGPRVIYDAYNASASGTIATLSTFADEPGDRRIAVLSSMAELGPDAPAMHERVGAHAARSNLDVLLAGGDFAASLAAGASGAGMPRDRIVTFAANGDAAAWLREHARERDSILLKGSRKYHMEEILDALRSART